MEKTTLKVRCQRIGCDATFSEDDNPDGSCRYHDSLIFFLLSLSSSLGSQSKPVNVVDKSPNLVGDASAINNSSVQAPKPKKIVDINEPQVCKNKGCGQTFKEKDNHDTACSYHPGPAVFHDRMRGWKCCDIHVKEFDEFMNIPPCSKGWHSADPES
ncbi:hypothetical protein LR48_Vigan02g219300 [Vigna angularis]|uniref:CHORD domain-containing protein n=1 Tax=Phaseolus angularis TaxID=3914 RepID=A0A0L9TZN0_PHAAN|nr:hypothetical protein LR48_Vigan02g219300 [Vigna angularis]